MAFKATRFLWSSDLTCSYSYSHTEIHIDGWRLTFDVRDPVPKRGSGTPGLSGLRDSSGQQLNQAATIDQSNPLNGCYQSCTEPPTWRSKGLLYMFTFLKDCCLQRAVKAWSSEGILLCRSWQWKHGNHQ